MWVLPAPSSHPLLGPELTLDLSDNVSRLFGRGLPEAAALPSRREALVAGGGVCLRGAGLREALAAAQLCSCDPGRRKPRVLPPSAVPPS